MKKTWSSHLDRRDHTKIKYVLREGSNTYTYRKEDGELMLHSFDDEPAVNELVGRNLVRMMWYTNGLKDRSNGKESVVIFNKKNHIIQLLEYWISGDKIASYTQEDDCKKFTLSDKYSNEDYNIIKKFEEMLVPRLFSNIEDPDTDIDESDEELKDSEVSEEENEDIPNPEDFEDLELEIEEVDENQNATFDQENARRDFENYELARGGLN